MAKEKSKDKPKKHKFQPSPYDWIALETEYLGGDIPKISEFFAAKGIPKNTYERRAVGWGEKRQKILQNAQKKVLSKLATQQAKILETHISVGSGLIKVGVDALVPEGDALKGLKPETAGEAAKIIATGVSIQQKALLVEKTDELAKLAPDAQVEVFINETEKRQIQIILKDPKLRRAAQTLVENLSDEP